MHPSILRKARGLEKASLVLKNCKIINVYTKEIEYGDIAIEQNTIIGIGFYHGVIEHDMKGYYVAPGFIDGHVHIESSMVTPPEFARLIVPFGTTTVIADPHEIANVSGIEGVKFMLDSSENIPLNVFLMAPSCVPATKEDMGGAILSVYDIKSLLDHPRVIGLGEVMDYPAVLEGDPDIHQKIHHAKDRIIDGHAPDMMGYDLNAYILSGMMTDHECTKPESMLARVQKGMYVHLREGSATKNTRDLLKGIKPAFFDRIMFCTDDKHPEDIEHEGHINFNVNLAIKEGVPAIDAIRMATLHPATCYHLPYLGAIAPGKQADLIVFNSLETITPLYVYHKGQLVAKEGKPLFDQMIKPPSHVLNSVRLDPNQLDFTLKLNQSRVHVIGLIKHNITTEKKERDIVLENGIFEHKHNPDLLKFAVIERHHGTQQMGIALVEHFGKLRGAIAMTIAHDSHNLIVIGSSDAAMTLACKRIHELQGGIVIAQDQAVLAELKLEVSGIMTNQKSEKVKEDLQFLRKTAYNNGVNPDMGDPFILLAFLSLPVIPQLKLTYRGLFDVDSYQFIPLESDDPQHA